MSTSGSGTILLPHREILQLVSRLTPYCSVECRRLSTMHRSQHCATIVLAPVAQNCVRADKVSSLPLFKICRNMCSFIAKVSICSKDFGLSTSRVVQQFLG